MLLTAAACQPQAGPLSDADVAAIKAVAPAIDRAALAHDWDAMFALFTEDAFSMVQGYPTAEGRSAMRESVESAMAGMTVTEHTIAFHEIAGSGDIAYARGTFNEAFAFEGSEQPIEASGRVLSILRRQPDGSWLVAVWTSISDVPLDSM